MIGDHSTYEGDAAEVVVGAGGRVWIEECGESRYLKVGRRKSEGVESNPGLKGTSTPRWKREVPSSPKKVVARAKSRKSCRRPCMEMSHRQVRLAKPLGPSRQLLVVTFVGL